jgi:hypothetical protein
MMTTREMYHLPSFDQIRFPLPGEIAAVVLAIAPLFVNLVETITVNGRVTSSTDYADIVLGFVLLAVAFGNFTALVRSEAIYKATRLAVAALMFVVAAVHIAAGGGLLMR